MKKIILTVIAAAISCCIAYTQPCLPEGIIFDSQISINNFPIEYPYCTEILGTVRIGPYYGISDITNLYGLADLTSIGGNLEIVQNDFLTHLVGLNSLNSVGGELILDNNPGLINLQGLSGLTSIGTNLSIWQNNSLNNISSLANLESVETIHIISNSSLHQLTGLEGITSLNGYLVIDGTALLNLIGLGNLISIGGGLNLNENGGLTDLSGLNSLNSIQGDLSITTNQSLISLDGLNNLTSIGSEIYIIGNNELSSCNIQNICNYLSNPSGTVMIYNNGPGCNNPWEIANSCGYILPCLPYGHYIFRKQSDIDSFHNYTNCTDLSGNVSISGSDINNLNGINLINSINGDLSIHDNNLLINLLDLGNLTFINGRLIIGDNNILASLSGLENIEPNSITNLFIKYNDNLSDCDIQSICGYLANPNGTIGIYNNTVGCNSQMEVEEACETHCLQEGITFSTQTEIDSFQINYPGCAEIEGDVEINGNDISDLEGIDVLTKIGGDLTIVSNDVLSSLTGLANLNSIDGNLLIAGNSILTIITGLDSIAPGTINDLSIFGNPSLCDCDVLSICQYLSAPGGTIEIHNNAPGCNSQQQVEDACLTDVLEARYEGIFTIIPNPLKSTTLITYTLKHNSPVTLKILDLSGREMVILVNEVQKQGEQKVVFNTTGLPAGVYFCALKTNEGVQTKKMIKL